MPDELEVTAWSEPSPVHDGTIQGLAHKHFPIWGVQFHPEVRHLLFLQCSLITQRQSISSTHGSTLLNTFIDRVHTHHGSPTAFPPLAKSVKEACAFRIASSPSKPQRSIVSGSSAPLQQRGEPSTRLRLVEKRFGELGRDLRTQDVFQTVVRSHKGKEKAVGEVWLDGQTVRFFWSSCNLISLETQPTRSTTSSLAAPSFLLTYSLSSRTIRFHRPCSTTAKLVLQDDETFWDWFASGQTALSARDVDPGGNGNQGWKGGWVGWFSYEMKEESLQGYGRKPRTPDREDEVDACWAWADRVLERAQEGEWIARGVIRDSSNEDQDWSNGRSAGTETLVDWLTRLGVSLGLKFADFNTYVADIESHLSSPIDSPEPASSFPSLKPISDSESYRHRIDACRQFIRQGESYELTLTTSFTGHDPTGADPFALYLRMRSSNPAYYSTYMSFACLDLHVLSTSPERFLRIDGKREIEMMPNKGTRARVKPGQCVCLPGRCDDGKACTEEAMVEDWRIGEALQSDTKERAENLMVTILPPVEVGGETEQTVDLIRSDLLSCFVPSTVTVPRLIELESYGVHNLVSTIRGTLAPNVGSAEAVKRCFPPGRFDVSLGEMMLMQCRRLDDWSTEVAIGATAG